MRRPRSTSRPCAAATARSDGIGRPVAARGRVGDADDGRAGLRERDRPVGDALDRGAEALLRGEGRVDLVGLERREAVGRDEERRAGRRAAAAAPSASSGARAPTSVATDITVRSR